MFGRRHDSQPGATKTPPPPPAPKAQASTAASPSPATPKPKPKAKPSASLPSQAPARASGSDARKSPEYYTIKSTIFNALIDTIDLTHLAQLDTESAREEIRDIVSEIVSIKNVVMAIAEQ